MWISITGDININFFKRKKVAKKERRKGNGLRPINLMIRFSLGISIYA